MPIYEHAFDELEKDIKDLAELGIPEEYRYQVLIAHELKLIRKSLRNLEDVGESQLLQLQLIQAES